MGICLLKVVLGQYLSSLGHVPILKTVITLGFCVCNFCGCCCYGVTVSFWQDSRGEESLKWWSERFSKFSNCLVCFFMSGIALPKSSHIFFSLLVSFACKEQRVYGCASSLYKLILGRQERVLEGELHFPCHPRQNFTCILTTLMSTKNPFFSYSKTTIMRLQPNFPSFSIYKQKNHKPSGL